MSETSSVEVQPVQIPGTVVDEVPHPSTVSTPAVPVSPAPASVDTPAAPVADKPADPTAAGAGESAGETAGEGEKKETRRGRGMAAGGSTVGDLPAPPPVPVWPDFANHPDAHYVPDEGFDATDLIQVNRELNRARARVFRCSDILKTCQRTLAEAQSNYDRQMRRALVTITGGTAESRKALAEIQCEEFENRVVVGKQVVEEWRRRCSDARDDLKALENISHNVRASLDIR